MKVVTVETKLCKYNIHVQDSFRSLGTILREQGIVNKKICIVADDNVAPLYLEEVKSIFQREDNEVASYVIPHGEENKCLETVSRMYATFIEKKLDRSSILVALGGGVTGDMVGFAAATYMRGISFIQIPTTLLSQVDSSIGGKTGVDFDGHKNVVGAFHQPLFVYVNTNTLSTLPLRQVSAGMGEIIKHGLIANDKYYEDLCQSSDAILSLNQDKLADVIYESCKIKSRVVQLDEKESGVRATLNFGHTIGHAIERLLDFSLLHGECVSVGIVAATHISYQLGYLQENDLHGIEKCLQSYGLPIAIQGLDSEKVYQQLFYDKKTKDDVLNFILLPKIGACEINKDLTKDVIVKAIDYILKGDSTCL